MCDSVGGHKGIRFDHPMWMAHLWQVPGWSRPGASSAARTPRQPGHHRRRPEPAPLSGDARRPPEAGGSVGGWTPDADDRPRRGCDRRATWLASRRRPRRVPVGVRDPRRPAQRREVDAAQPDPRPEGHDRLRQAADDPPPHPGRAQPARRPGGVRRHARHPQAPHARSASGSTATAEATIADVDVVVFVIDATQPLGRGDRWVAARVPRDAVVVVNKVDAARPGRCSASCSAAGRARPVRVLPRLGPHRRRRRRARRAPRHAAAGGAAVLPRRHGHRRARGVLGRRAGARAAAGGRPRRAAALDRDPRHGVGVAA